MKLIDVNCNSLLLIGSKVGSWMAIGNNKMMQSVRISPIILSPRWAGLGTLHQRSTNSVIKSRGNLVKLSAQPTEVNQI